ncbi:flagellar motor protein MotB [Sphingomonas immobilis]|uniref:Flagellar motor protein MotB n=1 Tax=Sphingomonas immobilis TaxID=3063997 RepID=A0ABT8ZV93_9SPHN|nr:flagellar motor protein MotB [Sphingomonas sp. CA1-15]MDO7841500.1 flagellar motor protein MotB [Sphingomonas sp. CA1-15]
MTLDDDFPETSQGRPAWLMTLADLALLLVGFFVFLQASQHLDKKALANGIRSGFGAETVPPVDAKADAPEPMPLAAAAVLDFAPGGANLPADPASIVAWAREAARDPRVSLKITGAVDGSPGDVDPLTGSGAILATDRARAVAAAIAAAHAVPAGRMTIVGAPRPTAGHRNVTVTLGFAGTRQIDAAQPDPLTAGKP